MWNTDNTNFTSGIFSSTNNFFFNFTFSFSYCFLNTGWINTTIFHETLESIPCYLTADGIKRRKNNHAWSVINHDIDTSGTLEGLNITTFLTNDTSFHFIVRKFERSDCTVGSYLRRHALHGGN